MATGWWCLGDATEQQLLGDLHILHLATDPPTWSGPLVVSGKGPPPSAGHSATLCGDRMLVFGGIRPVPTAQDPGRHSPPVYTIDLSFAHPTWDLLPTAGEGPSARFGHSAAQLAGLMILYGGCTSPGGAPGLRCAKDVWTLDLAANPSVWRMIPTEADPPTGRQSCAMIFHPPSASIFVLGGTACNVVPFGTALPPRRVTLKVNPLRALHCLPLLPVLPVSGPTIPVDGLLARAAASYQRVQTQRLRHGGRVPALFTPVAEFLTQATSPCLALVADLRDLWALLRSVSDRGQRLHTLQLAVRLRVDAAPVGATLLSASDLPQSDVANSTHIIAPPQHTESLGHLPGDANPALHRAPSLSTGSCNSPLMGTDPDPALSETLSLASDATEPWRCPAFGGAEQRALGQLIAERDQTQKEHAACCHAASDFGRKCAFANRLDAFIGTYLPALQSAWELLPGGETSDTPVLAETTADMDVAEELAATVGLCVRSTHDVVSTFMLAEAREACELGFATDEAVGALQKGIEDLALAFVEGDDSSERLGIQFLVEAVESVSLAEHIWLAQQTQRAHRCCPQLRQWVGALLVALRTVYVTAGRALRWAEEVQLAHEESTDPSPIVEEFLRQQDRLEAQCAAYWGAKSAFHPLRRTRGVKDSVILRAEQAVSQERLLLQKLQKEAEALEQRLVTLRLEHSPELPLLHSRLGWLRDATAPERDGGLGATMLTGREFDDYDALACWTQGRHLVHLAAFEDQKCCLKEYIVGSANVFRRELRLLVRAQHPNILPLQGVLWAEGERRAYLQFPWCLCSLKDWLKTQPPDVDIRAMTAQILVALAHLHSLGIPHCNVTLGNALIDHSGKRVLLAAFDVAKDGTQRGQSMMADREARTVVPPEVRAGQPVTTAADLWSFGHLLAAAYTGTGHANPMATLPIAKVPPELVPLLRQLLQEDPSGRPTAEQALASPYFRPTRQFSEHQHEALVAAHLAEQWRAVQSGLDAHHMAVSSASETVDRLRNRPIGAVASAVAARRQKTTRREHQAVLDLEQELLDGQWERLAQEWEDWLETTRQMEAARQCIEQQCGEVRGAVAAAAGQIGPTEVPVPLHWALASHRRHQPWVPQTEGWREPLEVWLADRLAASNCHAQVMEVHHVENWPLWTAYCNRRTMVALQMDPTGPADEVPPLPPMDPALGMRLDLMSSVRETLLCVTATNPTACTLWGLGFPVDQDRAPHGARMELFEAPTDIPSPDAESHDELPPVTEHFVLVARVCLGVPTELQPEDYGHCSTPCRSGCPPQLTCAHPRFHSATSAVPETPRSWALFEPNQCYPEFVVQFRCVPRADALTAAPSLSSVVLSSRTGTVRPLLPGRPHPPSDHPNLNQPPVSDCPAWATASRSTLPYNTAPDIDAMQLPWRPPSHAPDPSGCEVSAAGSDGAVFPEFESLSIASSTSAASHPARPKGPATRSYDFAAQFSNFLRPKPG